MVEDTMFSGESKNIEYKVSLPDKSQKYMKTIVAFANTQGGKLIVLMYFSLLSGKDTLYSIFFDSPENIVSSTILSLLLF